MEAAKTGLQKILKPAEDVAATVTEDDIKNFTMVPITAMANGITTMLNFVSHSVRVYGTCDEPRFCARDVAKLLGYKNISKAIGMHVDDYDRETFESVLSRTVPDWNALGFNQIELSTIYLTESGLYSLVFKSNLPAAKQFTRCITGIVLPSIRRMGGFQPAIPKQIDMSEEMKRELEEAKQRAAEEKERADKAEADARRKADEAAEAKVRADNAESSAAETLARVEKEKAKNAELEQELKAKDDALAERTQIVDQLMASLSIREPDSYIYIAFSNALARKHHHKNGQTCDLASRLPMYNTYVDQDTEVKYCDYWHVHDSHHVEARIKHALRPFQIPHGAPHRRFDETYHLVIERQRAIVRHICESYNREMDMVNDAIRSFREDFLRPAVIPKAIAIPSVEESKTSTRVIHAKSLAIPKEQEQKALMAKRIINSYLTERANSDFDINVPNQPPNTRIEIKWTCEAEDAPGLLEYFSQKLRHGEKQHLMKELKDWRAIFAEVLGNATGAITFTQKTARKK